MIRTMAKRFALTGLAAVLAAGAMGCSDPLAGVNFMDAENAPKGKGWVCLFNGKNLTGWQRREDHDRPMSWKVIDGALVNDPAEGQQGVDIVTEQRFRDFELYYEYAVPEHSNSGLYLRGLYEIQVREDSGANPDPGTNGGIWATAAPKVNASKPADEWQSVYARFCGQTVKVVILNGVTIHENVELTKATGGDLSQFITLEEPGPIMIQGDHGTVRFRNLYIRPCCCLGKKCGEGCGKCCGSGGCTKK